MTGAAIASAGMSVVNGVGARKDAKAAGKRADQEAAMSAEQRREAGLQMDKAIEQVSANQGNVDALQKFLSQMSAEGTEFAQGLMDDWEGAFGSVKDNLSDYYNNLDPTKYATAAKSNLGQQMEKSMAQFDETMAASGLQSAGMKQQAAKEAAFKQAEGNAAIDIGAEDKVMGMQHGWLNFGENQRQTAEKAMGVAQDNKTAFGERGFNAQIGQNNRLSDALAKRANFTTGAARDTQGIADKYGQSAADSSKASNAYFGNAMKSGLTAYNSYNNNNGLG